MPHNTPSHDASNTLLACCLVLSPAWASRLSDINELLTTVSLMIGIGFALVRIWLFLSKRR
ncbi:MAG TPA: hypothetical protein VKA94_01020 [Hyphomicrobiales bacterium]|nr:hypothetical protein [Hyphomicrobiales bacterium]